ncbi:MAG: hypothetical protein ACLRIS_21785 [Flavonifractor plautii]
MKNKKIIRLFTAALAVALCATAFLSPLSPVVGRANPTTPKLPGRRRTLRRTPRPQRSLSLMRKIPPAMIARTITRRQTGTPWTRSPNCWAAWGL